MKSKMKALLFCEVFAEGIRVTITRPWICQSHIPDLRLPFRHKAAP